MQRFLYKDSVHTNLKKIVNNLKHEPKNGLVSVSIRLGAQFKRHGISTIKTQASAV